MTGALSRRAFVAAGLSVAGGLMIAVARAPLAALGLYGNQRARRGISGNLLSHRTRAWVVPRAGRLPGQEGASIDRASHQLALGDLVGLGLGRRAHQHHAAAHGVGGMGASVRGSVLAGEAAEGGGHHARREGKQRSRAVRGAGRSV